jgi:hypothetical protein
MVILKIILWWPLLIMSPTLEDFDRFCHEWGIDWAMAHDTCKDGGPFLPLNLVVLRLPPHSVTPFIKFLLMLF